MALSKSCREAAVWLLALGFSQTACQNLKKAEDIKVVEQGGMIAQPGLLTVSKDQMPHLQIVAVHRATWSSACATRPSRGRRR